MASINCSAKSQLISITKFTRFVKFLGYVCLFQCSIEMAKQISQETFDAVVKENIEEFEMDPEEALNDAVQQFEAQVSCFLPALMTSIY